MTPGILTNRERRLIEEVAVHTEDARILRRAQALLWCDAGESATEGSKRLGVGRRTSYDWTARFHARRGREITARLRDGQRSGRPCPAAEIIEPLLDGVIDQDPREWGYRSTVWTAPLLRHYLGAEHGIKVARQSISLALARLRIRWKRPRPHLALRPPTWRQAKGGLHGASASGGAP